jgi:hypothetical protein
LPKAHKPLAPVGEPHYASRACPCCGYHVCKHGSLGQSSAFAQALAAKMQKHMEQVELAREQRMLESAERRMMDGRDCQFEPKLFDVPQPQLSLSEAFALMREPNPNYIYVNARTYAQLQKDIELCRVSEYLRDGEIQKGPVPPPPPNNEFFKALGVKRDQQITYGPTNEAEHIKLLTPVTVPNYFTQAADAARAAGFPKSAEEFARYAANREPLRIDD